MRACHLDRSAAILGAFLLLACGGDNGPTGLSAAERLARARAFQDKADEYQAMGAYGASFTLENAALSILEGADPATFTVRANGALSTGIAGGAPVTGATAGSYEGVAMRLRVVSSDFDATTDVLVGWRGGANPTNLVFAEDSDGDDFGGVFTAPNAEWVATDVTATFTSLNTPDDCDMPSAPRAEIGAVPTFTCKLGTMSGNFTISASEPSSFLTNTAAGSRTASASVSGFPAVSIIYDYRGAR